METFLNQIRIQQGEDWSLDKIISQSQSEYIPFIVSKRANPYFVITVASTKYEKNNRYVESWWLKYDGPMFVQSTPYYVGELSAHPTTKSSLPGISSHSAYDCLYQYTLSTDDIDSELQHKPYYYVYFDENNTLHFDYECRIVFNLTTKNSGAGTSNWGSQNYLYQITLVDGEKMIDTIRSAKDAHPELNWREDWPEDDLLEEWLQSTQKDVFNFIKSRIPNYFQTDIDWDSPLGQIWVPKSILAPTKLQVDNNLRKIL